MRLVKAEERDFKEAIYQLKITLREKDPEIWRRVLIPANFTLNKLHHVIQLSMGWTNSHLHQFEMGKTVYGDPLFDLNEFTPEDILKNSKRTKLYSIAGPGESFIYRYDFGDNWEHKIEVEQALNKEEVYNYPLCIDGAGACPPEDCGSMSGYEMLLKEIDDPENEEHYSTLMWLGGQFDPYSFDANRINRDCLWMRRW